MPFRPHRVFFGARSLLVSVISFRHLIYPPNFSAGESERVLHQLFDDAKQTKPSIIFLDELDALVSWCIHSTPTAKNHSMGLGSGTR